jgi:hypothetical protein
MRRAPGRLKVRRGAPGGLRGDPRLFSKNMNDLRLHGQKGQDVDEELRADARGSRRQPRLREADAPTRQEHRD